LDRLFRQIQKLFRIFREKFVPLRIHVRVFILKNRIKLNTVFNL
jgi:hypothetical protein